MTASSTDRTLRGAGGLYARWSRWAAAGLVLVVFGVGAFGLWSAEATAGAAQAAAAAGRLSDDYQQAAQAVAAEESLERKYRLEPDADVRKEHTQAAIDLVAALGRVHDEGGPAEAGTVDGILADHARYLVAVRQMFAAVDSGDTAQVQRIDSEQSDPLFDRVEHAVDAAAERHRVRYQALLAAMGRQTSIMSQGVPLVFVIGLAMAAMLAIVLRRYRHDLDDQRRRAVHDSLHDSLTGLPNRQLLTDRLDEAVQSAARRPDSRTGLVLLDLDRFKDINEALGHRYGDQLLTRIGPLLRSTLLRSTLRGTDTVARLGGDEFAVLLPDVSGIDDAVAVADKLLRATEEPLHIDGVDLNVEASAGVVVSGEHGSDAQTLLQRAEVAMYVAKQRKRGVAAYEPAEDAHDPERLALLGELRRGLDQHELILHYQPKIALGAGEVCGVEALVRWRHPQRGMIPPDRFIPLAEHTGLIGPFTRRVLDMALAQSHRWSLAGRPLPVSVNLAARNLADPDLFDDVVRLLDAHGVPPEMLCLELTESAITTEPEHASQLLTRMRGAGIALSIDDFGAGYTSLSQLKNLPVTELKIDRLFVGTMTTDRSNGLIVRSIVDLARNLGLTTVAEGVEDAETLRALGGLGCAVAQGYYLSRPLDAEAFDRWYAGAASGDAMAGYGRVA